MPGAASVDLRRRRPVSLHDGVTMNLRWSAAALMLAAGCRSPAARRRGRTAPAPVVVAVDAPAVDAPPVDAPAIDAPVADAAVPHGIGEGRLYDPFEDRLGRYEGPRTPPPIITMAVGEPSGAFGAFVPAQVARVIRARLGVFRACYQKELAHTPTLAPTLALVVELDLAADGNVTRAAIATGSSPATETIERCITTNLQRMRFPENRGPAATLRVPFTFAWKRP